MKPQTRWENRGNKQKNVDFHGIFAGVCWEFHSPDSSHEREKKVDRPQILNETSSSYRLVNFFRTIGREHVSDSYVCSFLVILPIMFMQLNYSL